MFLILNTEYNIINFLLVIFGSISTAFTLFFIIYVLSLFLRFSSKLFFIVTAIIFIGIDLSLIVDFFIYKIFCFHINAMVLNIITSPAALDSIQTGFTPVITFVLSLLILVALEIFFYKKTITILNNKEVNQKLNKLLAIPLILIIITEKVSYGVSSLMGYNDIYAKFKVIPLYQPLTFNRIAYKLFGYKKETINNTIKTSDKLNYPITKLEIQNKNKFNIFIIASDAARNDYITPETAPNLTKLKDDSIVFTHNYSGGNSTRFGIFSLFYALHSTYWFSFLDAKKGPVFFDVLQQLNYKINITSSTDTDWPEFKQTCYVNVQDGITDHFAGTPAQKDLNSSNYLISSLENHNTEQPQFHFLFLDAPHGYSYLPQNNKFNARAEHINYMKMKKDSKELQQAISSYKNAIYHNDALVGKIIEKLKQKNLYDNSLIVFTSDHGEEFYEYGSFGHNNDFSKAQLITPLIIKLPKDANVTLPASFPNTSTSHLDIVPTILTMLGVQNKPSEYSNGHNLFDTEYYRNYIFSANWNYNAIITEQFTYIFSNLPDKLFNNEVRTTETYKLITDQNINTKLLLDTLNENKKFFLLDHLK